MRSRFCVALPVTRRDIRSGINTRLLGLHLFRGAGYGNDCANIETYGKIIGPMRGAKVKTLGRIKGRPSSFLC